jgi:hypothetical protein
VLTPNGHVEYHALRVELDIQPTARTFAPVLIDHFAERLPQVRAKMVELVHFLFPSAPGHAIAAGMRYGPAQFIADSERDAWLGRALDAISCADFWYPGESARSGWAAKAARRAVIWENKPECSAGAGTISFKLPSC